MAGTRWLVHYDRKNNAEKQRKTKKNIKFRIKRESPMANTYTQIYMHVVFAVKGRESLMKPEWQDEIYRYISASLQDRGHTPYAINGTEDHIHLLFGMLPRESVSELVQSVKVQTSIFIKERYECLSFYWQTGYGAFSYSKSMLPAVSKYISLQKEHHAKHTFDSEIHAMLDEAGIEYDERFILHGII